MTDRIALFIDGANNHTAAKALGFEVDYKRLLFEFQKHGVLVRAFYYTAINADEDFSVIRPLVDWLDYNGFCVRTKLAKTSADGEGRRRYKRSMSVELAVDALEIARHVDHIFLFSGDGDLARLVESVQRIGSRVTVVSTTRMKPPIIADELRRQADAFVELDTLRISIERPPFPTAPE